MSDEQLSPTDWRLWEASLPNQVGARGIVSRWHDEVHRGVFSLCDEQPCHAINLHHWDRWGRA